MKSYRLTCLIVIALAMTPARAVDVPDAPKKLIIVDKLAAAGSAKAVYVAADRLIQELRISDDRRRQ